MIEVYSYFGQDIEETLVKCLNVRSLQSPTYNYLDFSLRQLENAHY